MPASAVRSGRTLSAWLDGSYTHVEDSGDFAILAAAPFISRVGWDYDYWGVKGGFAWNPAAGLTMGPEVAYTRTEFNAPGGLFGAPPGQLVDTQTDTWGVMWRVQRSF